MQQIVSGPQLLEIVSGPQLLEAALKHVESESIRAWALSLNNRHMWETIAERKVGQMDPMRFATYIVAEAMGF